MPENESSNKNTILYVIIGILAVLLVGFFAFQFMSQDSTDEGTGEGTPPYEDTEMVETGSISGTVEYHGIKPQGNDIGFVFIEYREHGQGEFQRLEGYTIPLRDEAPWQVDDVEAASGRACSLQNGPTGRRRVAVPPGARDRGVRSGAARARSRGRSNFQRLARRPIWSDRATAFHLRSRR